MSLGLLRTFLLRGPRRWVLAGLEAVVDGLTEVLQRPALVDRLVHLQGRAGQGARLIGRLGLLARDYLDMHAPASPPAGLF
jgi:hypothetical protein